MADLQVASVHKATADSRLNYDFSISIMSTIEAALAAAVLLDPPVYEVFLEYEINGSGVKQPDDSYISLSKLVGAIRSLGYEVSFYAPNGAVKLTVRIKQ